MAAKSFLADMFGIKKKEEEFNAMSLVSGFEKEVEKKVPQLKERDAKLDAEIAKLKSKLEDLETEKALIKKFLSSK